MKKLLILTTILAVPITAHAGMTAKSLEALKKYCVPDPNKYVDNTPVCGSEFEGKYNFNKSSCDCYDKHLKWNPDLRYCTVKCGAGGTFPRILKQSETNGKKCPSGYYPSTIIQR